MAVREILKMGDPRLLKVASPVTHFDTPVLHALVTDLFDTMAAAHGAGLAAPQIGVDAQVVIFGFDRLARYPDAEPVPRTGPIIEDEALADLAPARPAVPQTRIEQRRQGNRIVELTVTPAGSNRSYLIVNREGQRPLSVQELSAGLSTPRFIKFDF